MGMVNDTAKTPLRGDIFWADFGQPFGSEPGYRRPVLVVSSDRFNRSRLKTVQVAAITSNLRLADAPGNVEVASTDSGLPKDSVVNVTQVLTIDRARLDGYLGSLPAHLMHAVDTGLRLVFDL